jgi:hypothetical protein
MKDWQLLFTILFAVGWINWAIDTAKLKIIQRIEQLEAKIDAIDSRMDES